MPKQFPDESWKTVTSVVPVLDRGRVQTDETEQSNVTSRNSNNCKRNDYLDWKEFFMATAFLAAMRSKDPRSQVGACIVNKDNKILGIGYNGMPTGCNDDEYPWGKCNEDKYNDKSLYVCHAEMNAIMNKNHVDLKNCTIYVALFPCNECAKLIIQSGITEVVYASDKHSHKLKTKAAKKMFDSVGIKYWQYEPKQKIEIDFSSIDRIQ